MLFVPNMVMPLDALSCKADTPNRSLFRLLDLPRELRDTILEYALMPDRPMPLDLVGEGLYTWHVHGWLHSGSDLMRVNHQLAEETLRIIYKDATFCIKLQDDELADSLAWGVPLRGMSAVHFKYFLDSLKNFRHITLLAWYTSKEFVLDLIDFLLYAICHVYVLHRRMVEIDVDDYVKEDIWFNNLLGVLGKYSGKSTRISIRTAYIEGEALSRLRSSCRERAVELVEDVTA